MNIRTCVGKCLSDAKTQKNINVFLSNIHCPITQNKKWELTNNLGHMIYEVRNLVQNNEGDKNAIYTFFFV